MSNVLILEDNLSFSNFLKIVCKKLGHTSELYDFPLDAMADGAIERADLIITDFDMIGGTAIDVLNYMKDKGISTPVILNSGNTNAEALIQKEGLSHFIKASLNKDTSLEKIRETISNLL